MNYLLFAVYLIVLCWLLLRIPFIKNTGINNRVLLGLFLLKIIAGIAIGWIAIHIYGPGNDYWDVNDEAWKEYQLLIAHPGKYLVNIFTSDYQGGYSGIFNSFDSYWNDLRSNIIIKLVSIFNIFSRGDYYINSLFFNFLVFFGHIILYRLFIKLYPGKQLLVIIGSFLLPSTLYFASGIHKDGIVFLMLTVLIYCIYQSLLKERFTINRLLLICISMVLIFLVKNFIFLVLVPALFAWILSAKTKWHTGRTFAIVYVAVGILFFTIGPLTGKINPLQIIIKKQTEYINLPKAATQIKLSPLKPTFQSFAANAPEALNHSLLRPYVWELPVKSLVPLSIELLLYEVLLLLFIFFRRRTINAPDTPFLYFTIFFTLSVFLLIGYIVPNLGSIVRYRSIYLPLVVTPLLCSINWKQIARAIKIKK